MRNRYFLISDIVIVILCVYLSYVIRVEIFNLKHFWPGLMLYAFIASLLFPIIFRFIWQEYILYTGNMVL